MVAPVGLRVEHASATTGSAGASVTILALLRRDEAELGFRGQSRILIGSGRTALIDGACKDGRQHKHADKEHGEDLVVDGCEHLRSL